MSSNRQLECRLTIPRLKPHKSVRPKPRLQGNHAFDIRSTIDTILMEESMLTLNSELKEYWAKII